MSYNPENHHPRCISQSIDRDDPCQCEDCSDSLSWCDCSAFYDALVKPQTFKHDKILAFARLQVARQEMAKLFNDDSRFDRDPSPSF